MDFPTSKPSGRLCEQFRSIVTVTDDFVVTRTLELAGARPGTVTVGVKRPVPDGDNYRCEHLILGLGDDQIRYAMGIDGLQAFLLTLQVIGTTLYTSPEYKRGELRFLGRRNLGFPVPDIISDLVPKD
jgi:hypothetical protein